MEENLEDLFRLWDERFSKDLGPLHPRVGKLLEAFLRCGDSHFGFLRLRCECGCEKLVPFSCKSRGPCPSCSKKRALVWAERMVEEVLPEVPYVQIVFTIPKILRKAFLFDRSLLGELSKVAYAATKEFLAEHFPALEDPLCAMVVVPQSFGGLVNFHPHLHACLSLGVFDSKGAFHPLPDSFDFSPLVELFRERTFQMLLAKEKVTPERVAMLRTWKHSGFQVLSERRVQAHDRKGLESLLQYMERSPIFLDRLSYLDDGRVLYRGNYHPTLGRDHQLVCAVEFLALLVPHIALKYEVTIRTYGAVSTTIRKRLGWIGKEERGKTQAPKQVLVVDAEESEFVKVRRRNWARLIKKVWLDDPTLCPRCGKEMKVIAAICSPGQDDVIEKILRARGEWDPPWKRRRPARGPPPAGPCQALTRLDVELARNARVTADDDNVHFADPPHRDDDWLDEPEGCWPGEISET